MDNNASPTPEGDAAARRRSGRVVKAPTKFTPEPTSQSASKRKRDDQDEEDGENEAPESDEEMSDEGDHESDEDHPAPRSRKKSQTSRAKKPSSKKPKINGSQPARAAHPAGLPSRPKKTVRIETGDKGTGLFGKDRVLSCLALILTCYS
jgi:cohesin complex subunit SA-1/2